MNYNEILLHVIQKEAERKVKFQAKHDKLVKI